MESEKVLKAFEECLCKSHRYCSECYQQGPGLGFVCRNNVCLDVLDMLKEQEAVQPVTQSSVYDPDTWFFVCGSCKKGVINSGDKFCRWCGQEVKWE